MESTAQIQTVKNSKISLLTWAKFRREIFKDFCYLIVLLLLSFYFVYYLHPNYSRVFFIVVLLLFLISKKDYLWFAYFFILAQGPGFFFADFSGLSQCRLPLYTFLPGFSYIPLDLFLIMALGKAILKGKRKKLKFKKPLILILSYFVFSFFVTSFLFGTNIELLAGNLRWIFYYSVIISFLYLVNQKYEIYRFILLISPSVFFILFTQIYYVSTGIEFINLFNPGFRGVALNSLTGELRPLMGGILLSFFSFIFSLVLLENRDYKLTRWYLYLIIVISFFSIFISATRIWFVMFSFIMIGYIFVSRKKVRFSVGIIIILFLVVNIIISYSAITRDFLIQDSWSRVSQVFDIAKGDIYSVDTAVNRFFNQMPRLLNIIKHSPLIGYGFSTITRAYYDNDFGFLNTLLMFGVFGLALFIYFFIRYFTIIIRIIRRLCGSNPFIHPLKMLTIAWAGILIGYLSTWDFFTIYFQKVFFIGILIAITELFIRYADKEELSANKGSLP